MACISANDYQMSVSEFTDDDLLTQLETVTVQMAPTECIVPQTDNDDVNINSHLKHFETTIVLINDQPMKISAFFTQK